METVNNNRDKIPFGYFGGAFCCVFCFNCFLHTYSQGRWIPTILIFSRLPKSKKGSSESPNIMNWLHVGDERIKKMRRWLWATGVHEFHGGSEIFYNTETISLYWMPFIFSPYIFFIWAILKGLHQYISFRAQSFGGFRSIYIFLIMVLSSWNFFFSIEFSKPLITPNFQPVHVSLRSPVTAPQHPKSPWVSRFHPLNAHALF